MLEIKSLSTTPLDDIVDCMVQCFQGYFVPFNPSVDYWHDRFISARVEYSLSYGTFVDNHLIGFIIIAVGRQNGLRTAYNTGTGVLPSFRGQRVIDNMYYHAYPIFLREGIQLCTLEVIMENYSAISLYERLGFVKTKSYLCFRGSLDLKPAQDVTVTQSKCVLPPTHEEFYSWDCSMDSISAAPAEYRYVCYEVHDSRDQLIGHFVINPDTGLIAQYEVLDANSPDMWHILLSAVAQVSRSVFLKNVDARRTVLCDQLLMLGLTNFISQYEMELPMSLVCGHSEGGTNIS